MSKIGTKLVNVKEEGSIKVMYEANIAPAIPAKKPKWLEKCFLILKCFS